MTTPVNDHLKGNTDLLRRALDAAREHATGEAITAYNLLDVAVELFLNGRGCRQCGVTWAAHPVGDPGLGECPGDFGTAESEPKIDPNEYTEEDAKRAPLDIDRFSALMREYEPGHNGDRGTVKIGRYVGVQQSLHNPGEFAFVQRDTMGELLHTMSEEAAIGWKAEGAFDLWTGESIALTQSSPLVVVSHGGDAPLPYPDGWPEQPDLETEDDVEPVTVFKLAEFLLGYGPTSGGDFNAVGLPIMGGCGVCGATIAAYNACPSRDGVLMCASGCIGDRGWTRAHEARDGVFGHNLTVHTITYDPEQCVDGERGPDAVTETEFFAFQMETDDEDEHPTDWVVEFLQRIDTTEPSSGPGFDKRIWYSLADGSRLVDHATGRHEEITAHLGGFTEDELRAVWERVTRRVA